ncbi:MAG TPA: polyketide cyclase [Rhodanobacteraceae bacterium]|nr:polyketide cyclase [Rhodanobacteraceae bacterium]
MTRVLEFIVAIIMVFILAVIVGVFLPSHGHIQRSLSISHDPHQIYDVLNNFRRFDDYAGQVLKAEDPGLQLGVSGAAYGPGAKVTWSGGVDHVAPSTLTNVSGHLDPTGAGQIVWSLDSASWRGHDKQFALDLEPTNNQRLTKVTWSYDVDYGWNLLDRYSRFFLRGAPDTLLQYGLNNLQNTMASIPNVDYTKIDTRIVQTQPQAILFVSTQAPRTLDDVDAATEKAMQQIDAAIKKLGVHQSGPRTTITTDYGDENYVFDVAVPIGSTNLTIDGQAHDLTQITAKPTNSPGSAPAPATSAGTPPAAPAPGSIGPKGNLIVDANVRAGMLPGGPALEADWQGTPAGIPLMRLALKAYSLTHGYTFNDTTQRYYDELVSLPNAAYDQQQFRVFLPLQGDVPQQTPEQASGRVGPLPPLNPAAWSQAPAPAQNAAPAENGKKPAPAKKPAPKRRHHG